jgi:hypothetical protein
MAGDRNTKRNRRSGSAKARRRVVGLSSGVGAFLTLGVTQLATAPTVKADGFDAILDPIINSITSSAGDVAAGSAVVPELASLGLGAADPAAAVGLGSLPDVGSVAAATPADTWLQGLEQAWINSPFGQHVDAALSHWFNQVDPTAGASGLVSNGADAQAMSENLLVNPSFETADPSGTGYSGVTVPGWNETGTPTVIEYGTPRGYPFAFSHPLPTFTGAFAYPHVAPPGAGDNFAGGGPVASSTLSQTVDLTGAAGTPYTLSADLGGQGWNPSDATVQVTFEDASGGVLGTAHLDPVTVWDRLFTTGFQERDVSGTVPEGTTSAQVTTIFTDKNTVLGDYNGAYADNESFTVGDPSLTAGPLTTPSSDGVGQLDHVFVIYMENKGVGDIVGSKNAPYINSLINSNGYADNYFALGHPSDPNYIRPLGGSDFGLDYNPTGNVIDANSLMQEMDQADISWAGYAQSMPYPGDITSSGDYAVDQLPFAQFSYVYDNSIPGYLEQHLLPLTQLQSDLQNPSSFPEFTWIAADENHNMEGPIDSVGGIARFLISQFTNHQYNVAAGDQFVQQEISTIENSPTWTDTSQQDAIFLTFDEDNNNLSLGFGNEGNNVPMIVIPNGGAVDGGMHSAPFTTDDYYNEYSLMATIEDALRGHASPTVLDPLAPLTDNDKYAQPMNAFWNIIPPTG